MATIDNAFPVRRKLQHAADQHRTINAASAGGSVAPAASALVDQTP
jgi:hypothetical protein